MNLISLKDYASQKNISYEAVRQQVVRYKDELEGHIIRDGRQQFLDEDAVSFLDAKRQKNPVAIIQQSKDEEIEMLREQKETLLVKLAEQSERMEKLHIKIEDMMQLQLDAKTATLALEAAREEKAALQLSYDQTAADLERMRKEADQRARAAEDAEKRELEAQRRAELAAAELAAYKALPWWKKIFG